MARDKSMPSFLFSLNRHAAPGRALLTLFSGAAITLLIDAVLHAQLDQLFLVSGAGFTALYILGSAAAVKLLRLTGLKRIFPYVSLAVSIVVFLFVREYAIFPLAIGVLSFLWTRRMPHP